jgi:hypothetical protein
VANEPSASPPQFKVGDRVRVRTGVTDPDNPDMPIGRWTGVVEDVAPDEDPPAYVVRWDEHTRQNMHPVFVSRCKRDDLEVETMLLDQTDLESDDGAKLPLEQPTAIITRDLDPNDQDDRLRAIFGLTSNDPIPDVDEVPLRLYHAHLAMNLVFPFTARWTQETGPLQLRNRPVNVLELLPPDKIDPDDGVLCRVSMPGHEGIVPLALLEREGDTPQGRLLADYLHWFYVWGEPPSTLSFPDRQEPAMPGGMPGGMPEMPLMPVPSLSIGRILPWFAVFGIFYGVTLGALAVREGARTGIIIGASTFAVLLGLFGRNFGRTLNAMARLQRGPVILGILGVVVGGIIGAMAGAMAVAFLGTAAGGFLGVFLGDMLSPKTRKTRGKFLGGLLGACAGGIALSVSEDHEQAVAGILVGGLLGLAGIVFLALVVWIAAVLLLKRR